MLPAEGAPPELLPNLWNIPGKANGDVKKGYFYSEKLPSSPISRPSQLYPQKTDDIISEFHGISALFCSGFIKGSAQIVFLGVQKGEEAAAPCFVLPQAALLQKNGSVIAKCFQLFFLLFLH